MMYKKCMMLVACLLCMTFSALAQQEITFTWGTSGLPPILKTFSVEIDGGTLEVIWDASIPSAPVTIGTGPSSYSAIWSYNPSPGDSCDVIVRVTGGNFIAFSCNNTNMAILDVSEATLLETLNCGFNPGLVLTDPTLDPNPLHFNGNLEILNCNNNQWDTLNVTANPALMTLNCSNNLLQTLNVSNNPMLSTLNCSYNQLTVLDVNANPLVALQCQNNLIANLTLPTSTTLTRLLCSNNQLDSLDVTPYTGLITLECGNNQLTELDLTNNTSLTTLLCHNNNLGSIEYNTPPPFISSAFGTIWCYNNSILLGTLFDASVQIPDPNNKLLGTQVLDTIKVAVWGAPTKMLPYHPSHVTMEGVAPTQFEVDRNNGPINPITDYTISTVAGDRCISFNEIDTFSVVMTNAAIESSPTYPAELIVYYNVVQGYHITTIADGCGTLDILYLGDTIHKAVNSINHPDTVISYIPEYDSITISIHPCTCYEATVYVNGAYVLGPVTGGDYTHLVTQDDTITVEFTIIRYDVIASAGDGGTISPIGTTTVDCGDDLLFTLIPDFCFEIDELTVDGATVSPDSIINGIGYYTLSNIMLDSIHVHVTFDTSQYVVTATAGAGGVIIPAGNTTVNCDDSLTFTFIPDFCFEIDVVTVGTTSVTPDSIISGTGYYTIYNIVSDTSIHVTFDTIRYTITASSDAYGSITPSGTFTAKCCDTITFTFSAFDPCFIVDVLEVNGVPTAPDSIDVFHTGYYTINCVDDDYTIYVTFKEGPPAFIDVYSGPFGGGKVYPNGWIFPKCGKDTTFRIFPNPGYKINQVFVDGVNVPQAVIDGYYTFHNVVGSHTLVADFVYIGDDCVEPLYITASAGTIGGSIFPSGSAPVTCHSSKPYEINPQTGYQISGIFINGTNVPDSIPDAHYTFVDITVSQTIVVKFERIEYTIISSVETAGGTISPLGTKTVTYGGSQVYTISPQTGYTVDSVLIDSVRNITAETTGKYTFSNVTDNHTIQVYFGARKFTVTATAGANGTITPAGAVAVDYGTNQLFTFTPDAGFKVGQVLVNGKNNTAAVVNGFYEFTNVTANQVISVSFVPLPPPAPPAPPLGIEGIDSKAIVYPNPTTGELKIQNEGLEISTVLIFDMTGRLIQEIKNINNTEVNIDMSTYSEGVYFLNVDGQNIKVVKQ